MNHSIRASYRHCRSPLNSRFRNLRATARGFFISMGMRMWALFCLGMALSIGMGREAGAKDWGPCGNATNAILNDTCCSRNGFMLGSQCTGGTWTVGVALCSVAGPNDGTVLTCKATAAASPAAGAGPLPPPGPPAAAAAQGTGSSGSGTPPVTPAGGGGGGPPVTPAGAPASPVPASPAAAPAVTTPVTPAGTAAAAPAAAPAPGPTFSAPPRGESNYFSANGTSGDPCAISERVDSKYACAGTQSTLQMAQMSNMVTQMGGSMAAGMMGQQGQMAAMTAGTQSAALEAAAATQRNTAQMQLGIGAMNAALGAYQMMKSTQHLKNGREITGTAAGALDYTKADATNSSELEAVGRNDAGFVYSKGNNSAQNQIIKNFKLNEDYHFESQYHGKPAGGTAAEQQAYEEAALKYRDKEGKRKQIHIASALDEVGHKSNSEQNMVAQQAMAGGVMSLMMGGTQLMNGGRGMMAAKQLETTASNLKKAQGFVAPRPVELPKATNSTATAQTAGAPTSITGDGINAEASASTDPDALPTETPMDLGEAFNPLPMSSSVPEGVPGGKFNVAAPQAVGGGGGGMMGGGGNTSAASQSRDETQAKAAPNEKTLYESGGAVAQGGGGGGGRGADGGPDLSKLMEKFLPQKEDADKPRNEILNFGSAGPGSQPNYSPLGRNEDIFKRIAEEYQELQRHHFVGG